MKMMLFSAIALLAFAILPDNKLTGRWETKPSVTGTVTGVIFKTDGTLEGYLNKKPFTTGQYTFSNDTLSFTDNGCDGKRGVYRIIFFSNSDSMRAEPIMDSCDQRREGMKKLVLGRVNQ